MPFNARFLRSPDVVVPGGLKGSACCVWRDGLRSYVLTAAHVAGAEPEGSVVTWIGLVDGVTGQGTALNSELSWVAMQGGQLDASLLAVGTLGPFGSTLSYPWAAPIMAWDVIESPAVRSVVVCGKHGLVFATFDRKLPPGDTFGGRVHGRLLRFRFDAGRTLGGDSGAPIMSLPEGMLIGMHIAERLEDGNRYSLAVAAADVLAAYIFKLPGFGLRP